MDFTFKSAALCIALIFYIFDNYPAVAEKRGRPKHCKKACEHEMDCTSGNRNCLQDGNDCGLSCVNPSATCQALEDPIHGYVLSTDTVFNSKAEYGCYDGYELVGSSQRRCRGDRQWSGVNPLCRPVAKCGRLPEIFYGIHNGSIMQRQYDINTIIYYRCLKGYYPEDDRTSIPIANCSLDRTGRAKWHGPRLICRARSCPEAPTIMYSTRDGENFEYPNEISYTCDPGFKMYLNGREIPDGKLTLKCLEAGIWDNGFPACYSINCSYPHNPINGEVRGNSVSYMSEIHYTCKVGYRLVGQYSRKCKDDGTWTGNEPTCSEILCPPLKHLHNGEIENNSNKAGSTIYFRCWEATSLEGPESATCKLNGEWSNTLPICLAHCKVPYVLNGRIKDYEPSKMVRNGTNVTLNCDSGYEPEEAVNLICKNGTWLQPVSCKPANCDWPPAVKNAIAIFVKSKHGSYAKYECKAGFRPANNNKMQCRYGAWSWARIGEKFHCVRVFCINPRHAYGTLIGGRMLLEGQVGSYTFPDHNETEHGRMLTFQCNKGYILIGQPKATCINGTWMPKFKPECVQKKYPIIEGSILWSREKRSSNCQPMRSDYKRLITYSTINGTFAAKATCSEGYHFLEGQTNILIPCINGQWKRLFPKCVQVDKGRCRIPLKKNGFFILVENERLLHSGELIKSGSKVKLVCDPDTKINGFDTVECRKGKFLKRAGKCRPRRQVIKPCRRPTINKSFIAYRSSNTMGIASKIFISSQQTVFNSGTVIRYKCKSNRDHSAWDSIVCNNGKWNFFDEPCVSYIPKTATSSQELTCKYPNISPSHIILNGRKTSAPFNQRYPHGTLLKVACAYDFSPLSERILRLRCRHGRWTAKRRLYCRSENSMDRCACNYEVDINSKVRAYSPTLKRYISFSQKFPENAVLQFSCIELGETLLYGNDYTICRNGQWIFKTPKCVPLSVGDGPPPIKFLIQHGSYSISPRGELTVGVATTVHLYCLFALSKNYPVWETTSEYREYPKRKSSRTEFQFKNYSAFELIINAALFQDKGKFQCILPNGQRNTIKLLVKDKICKLSTNRQLLRVYPKQIHYFTGTTVQFSCPDKYQIEGVRSSICIDGEWSSPPPTCQPLQCPPIVLTDDALSVTVTSYAYGGLAHFSCSSTHKLVGNEYLQCSTNAKWSDKIPKCKSTLQCTFPGISPHCNTTAAPEPLYLQNDTLIYYTSEPDYRLDSDGVLVCLASGEWSKPLPSCSLI